MSNKKPRSLSGWQCPRCGFKGEPLEPLFPLRAAAMAIPMRYHSLKAFLSRHRTQFPARYRLVGRPHRRNRLLTAREIRMIRAMVLRGSQLPDAQLLMDSITFLNNPNSEEVFTWRREDG
jgi:hypothetical protein